MHNTTLSFNPILAREGQICPTKPKTWNFGQKYNTFVKTTMWQFLNLSKDSKNAKKKMLVLHWFGWIFENLQLVGQICPSLAINVIESLSDSFPPNLQCTFTPRAKDLKFWANVHHPLCVTCHISRVTCHVSYVTCQMSNVSTNINVRTTSNSNND